jgi:hypothetical protein
MLGWWWLFFNAVMPIKNTRTMMEEMALKTVYKHYDTFQQYLKGKYIKHMTNFNI